MCWAVKIGGALLLAFISPRSFVNAEEAFAEQVLVDELLAPETFSTRRIDEGEPSYTPVLASSSEVKARAGEPDGGDACLDNLKDGLLGRWFCKTEHKNTGFLDFNYYWDTRKTNVLTVNALAKLPYEFEYFQFVNYTSPLGEGSELEDWNDFFTELHLRRPIASRIRLLSHLDWNLMWADGGFAEEAGRFGIRWRFQDTPGALGRITSEILKMRYALTLHFLEDDGSGWQIEHVYRKNFFDGLIYIGGFADHNLNKDTRDSDWVTETQVGVKVGGNFYLVAEYRYNSFFPSGFRSGWGFGVEYFVPFR